MTDELFFKILIGSIIYLVSSFIAFILLSNAAQKYLSKEDYKQFSNYQFITFIPFISTIFILFSFCFMFKYEKRN
jgi:mannose/fructose/N-acetylgalactosamine-specific phosphotransferase system component IIC